MANDGGSGTSPVAVAVIALVSAAIAGAASFGAGYLAFASKDQELKVHLVEIAIGILRADPKEDVAPARGWAMDAIDKDSGLRPFTAEERAALLHKPLLDKRAIWLNADDAADWAGLLIKKGLLSQPPIEKPSPDDGGKAK
jgi:hypothetical protein